MALIGINGSGKTTMLKIISQVTYQSAGRCTVQGRIGALLSVTSGIHPELTGRENVYLYGAVLGMGRQTIRRRFDEIVEFAGLRMRSTGRSSSSRWGCRCVSGSPSLRSSNRTSCWWTRCLAVGDANFQQKCLKRIGEVVRNGTTLLYVSHDLASVEARARTPCGWPTPWSRRPVPPGKWWPSIGPPSKRTPRWSRPTRGRSRS